MHEPNSTHLTDILDSCLALMAFDGWTVEQCLDHFPEYRHELEPLLRTATRFNGASTVRPSAAFRGAAPARLQARLQASLRKPIVPSVTNRAAPRFIGRYWSLSIETWRNNMLAALAAIIIILGGAFGGVVYAADSSGPGDALYGLDQSLESLSLQLANGEEAKIKLEIKFAHERLDEASDSAEDGNKEEVEVALAGYDEAIAYLQSLLDSGDLTPEMQSLVEQAIAQLEAARESSGLVGEIEIEIEGDKLEVEIDGANDNGDDEDDDANENEDDDEDEDEDDDENANANANVNANANANVNENVNANTNLNDNSDDDDDDEDDDSNDNGDDDDEHDDDGGDDGDDD